MGSRWERWWPRLEWAVLLGAGFAWFVSRSQLFVLNPFQTAWMLLGDWEVYFNAQLLYMRSPWHLQLGAIPELLHPYGLSVFYSNAIFWLSAIGKLVEPLVGREFQLFGFWYCFCFVTQGLSARWMLSQAGVRGVGRLAGALLFLVDPVLMARMGHIALMTHCLILLQLGLAIRLVRRPEVAAKTAWWSVGVALFSIGVEAYLAAQCIPLCLGVLVMAAGPIGWKGIGVRLAALVAGSFAMLWVVGAIPMGHVDRTADGFGVFSADLLTLFDARNESIWLRGLGTSGPQGEGFGYLGIGVLACIPFALAGLWRVRGELRGWAWRAAPLLLLIMAMTVYAWSSHVTFAGKQVVTAEGFFAPFSVLTSAFRASGRFIWPLHYLVGITIVVAAARWATYAPWVSVLMLLAPGFQAKELRGNAGVYQPGELPALSSNWKGIGARYRHLAVVPVQVQWICDYDGGIVSLLTRVAAAEGMTVNSGNVGRAPAEVRSKCREELTAVDHDTLYVVAPQHRNDVGFRGAHCGVFENLWVCVSPDAKPPQLSQLTQLP